MKRTAEVLNLLRKPSSLETFTRRHAWITPEDQRQLPIPLDLTDSQLEFLSAITRLREIAARQNHGVFIDVVKPRQSYYSTIVAWDMATQMFLSEGALRCVLLADEYPRTEPIYRQHKTYVDYLTNPKRPSFLMWRDAKCLDGDRSVEYRDTGAHMETYSADSGRSVFGGAMNYGHITETAHMRSPDATFQGLNESFPNKPGTTLINETTGIASGEYYKSMFAKDMEHAQLLCVRYGVKEPLDLLSIVNPDGTIGVWDGTTFPLFVSWFRMPKYRYSPQLMDLTTEKLTRAEREYMDAYDLDLEQMAWRRYKILKASRSAKYSDEDPAIQVFANEYPATWEEAFGTVGSRTVLPGEMINIQFARAERIEHHGRKILSTGAEVDAIRRCEMRWKVPPEYSRDGYVTNASQLVASPYESSHGEILIYDTPVPEWQYRYLVGCDIAEGLAQGDRSVAAVLDQVENRFVALYFGLIPPDQFAELVAKICVYYNDAYSMGDYNKDGDTVVPRLVKFGRNVCRRPFLGKGKYAVKDGYWMRTTSESKKYGVKDCLMPWLELHPQGIPFRQFWLEGKTYVYEDGGAMGAESKRLNPSVKNYDDVFTACFHAIVGTRWSPAPKYGNKAYVPMSAGNDEEYDRRRMSGKSKVRSVARSLPADVGVEAL